MKKTTTYKELVHVVSYINSAESKEMGLDMKQDTKLTRKAVRFMKNIKQHIDDYNEATTDFQTEFASTYAKNKENDAKGLSGCLITNEKGGFVFTPENLKKRNEKIKELSLKQVEIDIVECADMDCIKNLSPIIKDTLNGFLFNIAEEDVEEDDSKKTEVTESAEMGDVRLD